MFLSRTFLVIVVTASGAVGASLARAERGTFVVSGETVELDVEMVAGDIVVGGDLIVDPNGFTKADSFWPDGVIPYTIHSSVRSTHRGYIEDAIQEYEAKTAVDWVPRNGEDAYVQFVELDDGACRAEPGYTGGRRQVKLRTGSTYCNVGVVTHEMGHALGLLHEQNRSDRAQYVQNLDGCLDGYSGNEIGSFDICSTMLYRSSTLSSCHIKLKPGTVSDRCPDSEECPGSSACSLYHNWATLSKGDVALMNALYPPATPEPDEPDAAPPSGPDAGAAALADGGAQADVDLTGGCGVAGANGGATFAAALALLLIARSSTGGGRRGSRSRRRGWSSCPCRHRCRRRCP